MRKIVSQLAGLLGKQSFGIWVYAVFDIFFFLYVSFDVAFLQELHDFE